MPDNNNSDGRRRRRRGRGNGNGNRANDTRDIRTGGPQRQRNYEPTGFQKFLSVISFGLLGKSSSKPQAERPKPAPPVRFENGGDQRKGGERGERRERDGNREARPPREPRPAPTPAEVTTPRLYVGNLSYDATESDLFELFNGVGKVQNAEVVVNNRTQRSKGFAFITMASLEEAKRAVAELNGKDFMGRGLQISGAKPQPERGSEGDSGSSSDETPAAEEQAAA